MWGLGLVSKHLYWHLHSHYSKHIKPIKSFNCIYGSFVWTQADHTLGCFSSGGHRAVPSGPPKRGCGLQGALGYSLGTGRCSDRKLNLEESLRVEKTSGPSLGLLLSCLDFEEAETVFMATSSGETTSAT